jgi:hypothetical protein
VSIFSAALLHASFADRGRRGTDSKEREAATQAAGQREREEEVEVEAEVGLGP